MSGFKTRPVITRLPHRSWRRGCDSKIQIPSDSPLIIPSVRCEGSFCGANRSYRRGRKTSRVRGLKGSGGYHPSRIPATWRRPTPRGVTLEAVGSPWSTRLSTPARDFARDCRRHPTRRRLAPPSSPSLSRKPRRRFYPPNPPRTPEERQRPNPRGARLSSLGTFTVGPSPAEGSQITNRLRGSS